MAPTVSVVTATFNYGQYLPQALDSILAQTFTDWESIIVDDGSTDDTLEIVRPYLKDPRFRYIKTEHRGQPAAKNVGIRAARGKLLAFLDADDVWLAKKLECQVRLFRSSPGLGVVFCRRAYIDASGARIVGNPPSPSRGWVLTRMFFDNFVCFSSSVVPQLVFKEVGVFDECIPYAIDWDLWLRVAARYPFDYVDDVLVLYRTGHSSLSAKYGEKRLRLALVIMHRFLNEHGGRRLLPQSVIRQGYAETYAHVGRAIARRSLVEAQFWFLRALLRDPLCAEAWRTMLQSTVPPWIKPPLRALLRRGRAATAPASLRS